MKKTLFVSASFVKFSSDELDISFVPPMTRRRFSLLQKVSFFLLNKVAPVGEEIKIVFASRDGEGKLTSDIVQAYNEEGSVSPWKFSSSVYNASPGLYSVYAKNHASYTAIAAGEETIENSLIEAIFETESVAWCYAEETQSGYGAAIRFGPTTGRKLQVSAGNNEKSPINFEDIAKFIAGEILLLEGKRISFKWVS